MILPSPTVKMKCTLNLNAVAADLKFDVVFHVHLMSKFIIMTIETPHAAYNFR